MPDSPNGTYRTNNLDLAGYLVYRAKRAGFKVRHEFETVSGERYPIFVRIYGLRDDLWRENHVQEFTDGRGLVEPKSWNSFRRDFMFTVKTLSKNAKEDTSKGKD